MAMNIKQAKEEIRNTLTAYLAKDELGNYQIPSLRQRPVLLMGPPGIGKTQIMAQIAAETGVGLVSYTITHHTRQSAVGLPFIEHRTYDGESVATTEYTMSEILASVYNLMEKTGVKEGILFLDEINCVSETLAPMMLQFLQCKTFGNRAMPEGWLICAAGNPPEYNRSVRDFDVVTLDRVKRIDVEEDFSVWKEYAISKGLHGAVISYLDIKKDNFYRIENTVDGLRFATARGWEDLSELIFAYEKLGIRVTREVVEQYIQMPQIAKDFASYLELYYKYQTTYRVGDILEGVFEPVTVSALRRAPFDEKLSVMGLLYARLAESARKTRAADELAEDVFVDLKAFQAGSTDLTALAEGRAARMKAARDAGHLDRPAQLRMQREIAALESFLKVLEEADAAELAASDRAAAVDLIRPHFQSITDAREAAADATGAKFDNVFRYLEEAFGQGQELVIFVTEITAGTDTSWFVENFGCDAYYRHNRELLFDDTRRKIEEEVRGIHAE